MSEAEPDRKVVILTGEAMSESMHMAMTRLADVTGRMVVVVRHGTHTVSHDDSGGVVDQLDWFAFEMTEHDIDKRINLAPEYGTPSKQRLCGLRDRTKWKLGKLNPPTAPVSIRDTRRSERKGKRKGRR